MRGVGYRWRSRRAANRERADGSRSLRALLKPFFQPHRGKIVAVAAIAFIGGLVEAATLVLVARTALAIASDDSRFFIPVGPLGDVSVTVTAMLAVAALLVLVRMTFSLAQAQLTAVTSSEIGRSARRQLVGLYLGSTWSVQSEVRAGRLQELVSSVALTAAGTGDRLVQGWVAGLSFAALILTAFAVNAVASIAVGVLALLLAAAFHPLRRAVRRRARATVKANVELATSVTEVAGLAQEIRIFEAETTVTEVIGARIDKAARRLRSQRKLADSIPATYQGAALALVVGALAAVYAAGFSRLSALSGVMLIMLRSLTYGQALQRSIQGVHESAPTLELLVSELDRLRAAQAARGGDPVAGIGALTFERVSFRYPDQHDALCEVSFATARGEVIGIVGPSGAGKSTLVQLILRLRDPSEGRVLADGRDVSELSLDDWYHHVTFVPQDAHLFAGSIADNIRFFRPDVTDEQIVSASVLANLHHEVMARPEGYAAEVGERGGRLSGGQRQRLCIARALVSQPDVLVLDEPTSALDVQSEVLIREALAKISRTTTIFIIAHRLSTLAICNRIMVLQAGALVGFDTPGRLEETTPFYRDALELAGLK